MLKVNRERYSKEQFQARIAVYEKMECFQNLAGKRFALCITDPFDVLTLVFFLKEHGGSILLIHGETPKEKAYNMAADARCFGLLYGGAEQFQYIEGKASIDTTPSLFQYSSGTTGAPKLIQRAWTDIDREIEAYNKAIACEVDETPIVLAPVSHSYGLICGTLSALARGSEPIIVTNKNPKFALNMIRETPKHIVYAVPLMLHIMGSFPQGMFQFHKVMTSGSPMPKELFHKLQKMTTFMMQQYGCSEAGCISICKDMKSHLDLGHPLEHAVVQTSDGEDSPAEIIVTIGDKVIYTQDLGYKSELRLHFVGRMDDVINVSGLKVFPLEVEETMLRLDGIKEAVVYRGKHPVMGEIVKAQVVAKEDMDTDEIREWCLAQLPPYKVPHEVICVTEIPKNATGKVSRKLLEMGDVTV